MYSVADISMSVALFPNKLFRMLNDTQCHSLYWGASGDHLVINTRDFEDELLQNTAARWRYQLKTTSTTSFIRQLHAYGFRKVLESFNLDRPTEPNHIRRYYHPYFHRDRVDLLIFMKRSVRSSTRRPVSSASLTGTLIKRQLVNEVPGHMGSRVFTGFRPPSMFMKRRRKTQPSRHPSFDNKRYRTENLETPASDNRLILNQIRRKTPEPEAAKQKPPNRTCLVKEEKIEEESFPQPKKSKIAEVITKITGKSSEKVAESPDKEEQPVRMRTRSCKKSSNDAPAESDIGLEKITEKKDISETTIVSRPKEPPSNAPNQPNPPNPPKLITQPEPKQKTTKPVRPTPLLPTAPQFPGDFPAYPPPPSFYPYQPRPNMDLRPRFIKPANIPSTPPTAANNARVAVPPYSVLQPAYIAWPTRKAYCPRAKQWVHPRPTIIPLSFTRPSGAQINNSASQAIPPDNMGGFPFYPPQWGQYPVKEEPLTMHPMIPDLHCSTQEKKETK